jgi:hypothetical protein
MQMPPEASRFRGHFRVPFDIGHPGNQIFPWTQRRKKALFGAHFCLEWDSTGKFPGRLHRYPGNMEGIP